MLYGWPVPEKDLLGFSRFESPAHTKTRDKDGKLQLIFACDFLVPLGTNVLTMAHGRVVYVKQDSSIGGSDLEKILKGGKRIQDSKFWHKGNRIEVSHSNGEYSAYEHLEIDSVSVKVKDMISEGQKIARTGNTGLMTHLGPHLHVERFRITGDSEEDYLTMRINWKNYDKLLNKLWDYNKWREIAKA